MARILKSKRNEAESEIDLTPMLDVVFIMLIFFIVTASFVKEYGVDVQRPDASQQQQNEENVSIVVFVDNNSEIRIENRRIDIRAVRANIERLHAERPQAPVVIQAEKDAEASVIVAIADAARESNIYNVSLVAAAN